MSVDTELLADYPELTKTVSTRSASGKWRSLDLSTDWNSVPYVEEEVRVSFTQWFAPWHETAICSTMSPDTFFGSPEEQRSMSPRMIKEAAAICAECPVFRDCLTYALTNNEQYGVWAGTSGRVRQRIQRMIAIGMVTVDGVVEDYVNGRKEAYEGRGAARQGSQSS